MWGLVHDCLSCIQGLSGSPLIAIALAAAFPLPAVTPPTPPVVVISSLTLFGPSGWTAPSIASGGTPAALFPARCSQYSDSVTNAPPTMYFQLRGLGNRVKLTATWQTFRRDLTISALVAPKPYSRSNLVQIMRVTLTGVGGVRPR